MKMIIQYTCARMEKAMAEDNYKTLQKDRFFLRGSKNKKGIIICSFGKPENEKIDIVYTNNIYRSTHGDLEDMKKLQKRIHNQYEDEMTELCSMSNRHFVMLWKAEKKENIPATIRDIINVVNRCPYDPEDIAMELCMKHYNELSEFIYPTKKNDTDFPGCPPGCECPSDKGCGIG